MRAETSPGVLRATECALLHLLIEKLQFLCLCGRRHSQDVVLPSVEHRQVHCNSCGVLGLYRARVGRSKAVSSGRLSVKRPGRISVQQSLLCARAGYHSGFGGTSAIAWLDIWRGLRLMMGAMDPSKGFLGLYLQSARLRRLRSEQSPYLTHTCSRPLNEPRSEPLPLSGGDLCIF